MTLEQLIELLGENQEAVDFVNTMHTTNANNVQTINKNETLITNLKGDLEKFKIGNTLVKSKLGLEQLNEESLTEALAKLNKAKGDDALNLEIENLKTQLAQANEGYQTKESDLISQIRSLKNGTVLADEIAKSQMIKDPQARKDAQTIIQGMVSYNDNNEAIFLNEDGTTKFNSNNQPFGYQDAINEILSTREYWIDKEVKGGGGSQSNNGGYSHQEQQENPYEGMFK